MTEDANYGAILQHVIDRAFAAGRDEGYTAGLEDGTARADMDFARGYAEGYNQGIEDYAHE